MQTRFTPSLETLGDRLNLSPWVPTTEQTLQISIVVDLAPPELGLRASASQTAIPSVTDLVIDSYNGRSVVTDGPVTWRITSIAVDPSLRDGVDREGEYSWAYLVKRVLASSPTTLEGHECLVFFLGGVPSSEVVPKYWVFGTELPQIADTQIRHRMFAIVDRTQMATEAVAILTSSLPGSDAQLARRNLVTTHSFDLDRPGSTSEQDRVGPFFEFTSKRLQPSAAGGGSTFKILFATQTLEIDPADGDASGITVVLQRLANPSIPYEGTHVLYQDIFIPAAEPIALARDAKSSGM
jgi:hypothetical protein